MSSKILFISNGIIPSVELGILQPVLSLNQSHAYNIQYEDMHLLNVKNLIKKIRTSDLVLLCRSTLPQEEIILRTLIYFKIPYIYEIDDNFFEIPQTTEVARFHRKNINLVMHHEFIKYASLVRVYSAAMVDTVKEINSNVVKCKTYVDLDRLTANISARNKRQKVLIGYPTGRSDDLRIERLLLSIFSNVLKNDNFNIELHLWNNELYQELRKYNNVYYHEPIRNYEKFVEYLLELDLDIGIAPLPDLNFYQCKTENKFREYGAAGIAGIYSDVKPYRGVVTDFETGILTDFQTESWINAINLLVKDKELRANITKNAKLYVEQNYQFTDFVVELKGQIDDLLIKDQIRYREPVRLENVKVAFECRRSSNFSLVRIEDDPDLYDLSELYNVSVNELDGIYNADIKIKVLIVDQANKYNYDEIRYASLNFDVLDLTQLNSADVYFFLNNIDVVEIGVPVMIDATKIEKKDLPPAIGLSNLLKLTQRSAIGPSRESYLYSIFRQKLVKLDKIRKPRKKSFLEIYVAWFSNKYAMINLLLLVLKYKYRFKFKKP